MLCTSATWDLPRLSALTRGTYSSSTVASGSLFWREAPPASKACSGWRCAPQPALTVRKAQVAAELAEKTQWLQLLAEQHRQAAGWTAVLTRQLGLHIHQSKGIAEMERTEKLSTGTVRAGGGEMEETKLILERRVLLWLRKGGLGGWHSM